MHFLGAGGGAAPEGAGGVVSIADTLDVEGATASTEAVVCR